MTTKNETQGLTQGIVVSVQCFLMHIQEHATSMRVLYRGVRGDQADDKNPQRKDTRDRRGWVRAISKHKRQQEATQHMVLSPQAPFSAPRATWADRFLSSERVHALLRVVLSFKVCPAFKPLSTALRSKGVLIAPPVPDADSRPTCACRRLSCPTL